MFLTLLYHSLTNSSGYQASRFLTRWRSGNYSRITIVSRGRVMFRDQGPKPSKQLQHIRPPHQQCWVVVAYTIIKNWSPCYLGVSWELRRSLVHKSKRIKLHTRSMDQAIYIQRAPLTSLGDRSCGPPRHSETQPSSFPSGCSEYFPVLPLCANKSRHLDLQRVLELNQVLNEPQI